jgi:hypothetical protein
MEEDNEVSTEPMEEDNEVSMEPMEEDNEVSMEPWRSTRTWRKGRRTKMSSEDMK